MAPKRSRDAGPNKEMACNTVGEGGVGEAKGGVHTVCVLCLRAREVTKKAARHEEKLKRSDATNAASQLKAHTTPPATLTQHHALSSSSSSPSHTNTDHTSTTPGRQTRQAKASHR